MVVRVGINGFGRIGRVIFRTCLQNNDIELSAINDPALTAEYICYLIKFDSTHGKFNKSVTYANDEINVEDQIIKIFHEKMPSSVPWHTAGVQYVIEASGMFTTLDKACGHMQSDGVKRVIVTAPSVDVPMIILGVNDFRLRSEQKVLSCASSTLYCLAPIIKVLEDEFGISEGFVTSIHAMTPSLKPLDGLCLRGKHWRDYRSIHQNIIPATTGACRALGKIIPQVKDKMAGLAFRVPIVNVSVLDITVRLTTNTTLEDIVKNIEKASKTHMKNIIKISLDETVSSDHIGENHSCIFDLESSLQLKPNFYKLICWYENEYSYACRVIDSIFFSERQLSLVSISSKMTYVRTKPSKKYDVVQQTECLSKEISVEYKHKELCSISLGTDFKIKESDRNVILNKPLSAHISGKASVSMGSRETKRRNEIFKIWNDSNDISKSCVRQNRGSFFHSCISFAPKPSYEKPNERLENDKRDISKISNLTDDLLKKTYNSKTEADVDPNISTDNVNKNASTPLNVSQEETTNHKKIFTMRTFDTCGDYANRKKIADSQVLDGCSKEELTGIYDSYNKDISNYSIVAKEDASKERTDKIFKKTNPVIIPEKSQRAKTKTESHKTLGAEDKSTMLNHDNTFTDQVAKAINTLIDGLEQSFNVSCKSDHQNSHRNGIRRVKEIFQKKCTNENINVESKQTNDLDITNNCMKNLDKENKLVNLKADHMANMTKKEKNDLNIATETKYKIMHLNKKIYKKQIVLKPTTNNVVTETDNKDENKYSAKKTLNGLNSVSPDLVVMVCADKTRPDNTNVGKKFIVKVPKQDIFDKLESVSETDSENSFDIHGRKSQVIHITDLTKSLEDLGNLDKICKIIEISDELSDKLFSTVSSVGQNLKRKEWSFRDLCERIKLDEFCNKVFGKTAL